MEIKDIMIRDVTTLSPDMPAKEAIKKLSEMEISGLPVVKSDGKLAGMFTEKGILKAILPSYVEKVGRFIYEENPKAIKNRLEALNDFKVKDLMRKEVITVREDTGLCETARIMLTEEVQRIPVVDKENKVVGIVARCDILNALLKEESF